MTLLNKTLTTIGLTSIVIGSLAQGAQAGPICRGLIARDNQVHTQFIQQAEQAAVAGNWDRVVAVAQSAGSYSDRVNSRLMANGCLDGEGYWTSKTPTDMVEYSYSIGDRWEAIEARAQADVALAAVASALSFIF